MFCVDGIGPRPMAEKRKLAEPEIKIRRAPRPDEREFDHESITRLYDDDYTVDLSPYLAALGERWRALAAAAMAAAMAAALVSGLLLPKWYRATAVIRPIATPAVENRIAGVLGGLGGGLGLSGLAASIGEGGNNDAEEYLAILRGFDFNVTLAGRHHLTVELLKPGLLGFLHSSKIGDRDWAVYRVLEKRFDCDYSIKTGNITLSFESHNRADAENILRYYIGDLRDLLRSREIISASSAIDSLKDEANSTPDSLLRSQLYDLVAKQVERKKMAQVEADFAFRVLDPPAASDKPYRPSVLMDSAIAALLAVIVYSLCVAYSVRFGNSSFAEVAERRSHL
jgi:hypothetical protein